MRSMGAAAFFFCVCSSVVRILLHSHSRMLILSGIAARSVSARGFIGTRALRTHTHTHIIPTLTHTRRSSLAWLRLARLSVVVVVLLASTTSLVLIY